MRDILTGGENADNGEQESPTARPRANLPAFVYDTHTVVEEESGTSRQEPTTQMSTPSDTMDSKQELSTA